MASDISNVQAEVTYTGEPYSATVGCNYLTMRILAIGNYGPYS